MLFAERIKDKRNQNGAYITVLRKWMVELVLEITKRKDLFRGANEQGVVEGGDRIRSKMIRHIEK